MAAAPSRAARDDPSSHTKWELGNRGAETVAVVGSLARVVVKSASSPALKSTLAAFADYERTVDSTSEMLRKINQGMADLDEAIVRARPFTRYSRAEFSSIRRTGRGIRLALWLGRPEPAVCRLAPRRAGDRRRGPPAGEGCAHARQIPTQRENRPIAVHRPSPETARGHARRLVCRSEASAWCSRSSPSASSSSAIARAGSPLTAFYHSVTVCRVLSSRASRASMRRVRRRRAVRREAEHNEAKFAMEIPHENRCGAPRRSARKVVLPVISSQPVNHGRTLRQGH